MRAPTLTRWLGLLALCIGAGAAKAQTPPFDCEAQNACWDLQIQIMNVPQGADASDYQVQVFYGDDADPLTTTVKGRTATVQLPRLNPNRGGVYQFELTIAHNGDELFENRIHFDAPAYVRLAPIKIPVFLATPPLQRGTALGMERDSRSHAGGDAALWRIYFQSLLMLPKATHNPLINRPLEKALFNACSGLARMHPTFVIYHFDPATCLLDKSLFSKSEVNDAELSHWLLYNYAKSISDDYIADAGRKNELQHLYNTLSWLHTKAQDGSEQEHIAEYRNEHTDSLDLIPADKEFDQVLANLHCALSGGCR